MVKVANFVNRFDAEYAKGILESRGVPTQVVADDAGGLYSNLLTGGMGAWVAVRPEDTAIATAILQEANNVVDEAELDAEAMFYDPPADA
jgi:hypothetical protein